jgi:hypothetical protein
MSSIDSIIDTERFSKWIGLQTKSSANILNKQLSEWNTDEKTLSKYSSRFRRFKEAFEKDSSFFADCKSIFTEIADI